MGEYEKALESYREYQKMFPDRNDVYWDFKEVYEYMGRFEDAYRALEEGFGKNPSESVRPDQADLLVEICLLYTSTVNIGKRSGRILTGFSVALIALMPLLGYWLVAEEFTPIRWEITPEAMILRHVWEEDRILFQDVQSVEWLDSLPKISRQKGSSIGEMRKGKYRVEGMGICLSLIHILSTGSFGNRFEWKPKFISGRRRPDGRKSAGQHEKRITKNEDAAGRGILAGSVLIFWQNPF